MSQYQPWSSSKTERADLRSGGRTLVALALASAALLAGCAGESEAPSTHASTPAESATTTSTTPPPPPAPPPSLPTPRDRCCQASMN